jgi:hypothetical protein
MSVIITQGIDYVTDWIWGITDLLPPFCVEIVLNDGTRYYLHSISGKDEETKSIVIRIWDLRAFSSQEIDKLKDKLNQIKNRKELENEQKIHPKLDWANLRVYISQIAYCIEWHDRLWPEDNRPKIGF